ncbi:IS1182 family transposase [uncultured Kiloniella sp.]|uniref:IS1182 family transposase n=1 Tax=uncultured Kiloniella sp. TaxID=1133091 RepID=UPI002612C536|nr:IS1182 family transposase [uncultured Kiloniella sp.]
MLKKEGPVQSELEMVSLESLVPTTHLLRKIAAHIDFSFIHDRVAHLYCANNGRPALDPTVLFKILVIGYLFGVRSERQLMREIEVNVAYRWFLGMRLTDKVPDASTLSQNRRRRFTGTSVYQDIFDEIVLQAIKAGLVDGHTLYTDSTHLKANANKQKFDQEVIGKSRADYLDALDEAIDTDRAAHGKKPLKSKDREVITKKTKVSRTDKDAGYMVREGKPKGFFYLDHRTVDGAHAIITDSHVTAGNVHDSIPYLSRLDHQCKRFDLDVKTVGLDAGYMTAGICKGLDDRKIHGVIGYRRPNHRKGFLYKREYEYLPGIDGYRCPGGQILKYSTTSRTGYREYKSNGKQCQTCPFLDQCTSSSNHVKVITRHVWQDIKDKTDQNRLSTWGKAVYKRRKETVERSFADAKQLHGHRYARLRGLDKVKEQCLLAAATQNIKKIALVLARNIFLWCKITLKTDKQSQLNLLIVS